MVDKGDAIKIETGGQIVEEPDANLKISTQAGYRA